MLNKNMLAGLFLAFICAVILCMSAAQKKLQLEQAFRTARLFKSLGVMEREEILSGAAREKGLTEKTLETYFLHHYQSKDYNFKIYTTANDTYFYARAFLSEFAEVYNSLYYEAAHDRMYCLALKDSSSSQKLCRALDGANPVAAKEVMFPLLADPGTARLEAYQVDMQKIEPLF